MVVQQSEWEFSRSHQRAYLVQIILNGSWLNLTKPSYTHQEKIYIQVADKWMSLFCPQYSYQQNDVLYQNEN